MEEGIGVPLDQDCRVARDGESEGVKALRRAAFVRWWPSASPVGSFVHGLSPTGRIACGWRAGTVVASAGGRHCWPREARMPHLARRLSRRLQCCAAAARLRAVGASEHAR